MERIDKILEKTIDDLGLKKRMEEMASIDIWSRVAGELISSKTRAKKVRGSKLWVEVSSSVWMSELVYWKPKLISRINKALKGNVIEDIIFVSKEE
jgi:predicted nucleic acid-binding Zn ribbon protein